MKYGLFNDYYQLMLTLEARWPGRRGKEVGYFPIQNVGTLC